MCDSPYIVRAGKDYDSPSKLNIKLKFTRNGDSYAVPCGKCPPCKKRRKSDWSIRLQYENRRALSCYFITLTYEIGALRYAMDCKKPTLVTEHHTNFMKQLRNYEHRDPVKPKQRKPIKFYMCGEYGETHWRPHYHYIIFNVLNTENFAKAWSVEGKQRGKIDIQTEPSGGAFAYVAGYLDKSSRIPQFQGDDRQKEFSRMSQKIGDNYLTEEVIRWHKLDPINHNYMIRDGGIKQALPRYYRKKIYNDVERWLQYDNQQFIEQTRRAEIEAGLHGAENLTIFEKQDQEKQLRIVQHDLINKSKRKDKWQS